MTLIISLVVISLLLLLVELLLLPGTTVAAIFAVVAFVGAIYFAFVDYGSTAGWLTIGVIAVLSVLSTILFIAKAKTWGKLSLKTNVDGVSQEQPQEKNLKVGDVGITTTRLGPIGKVKIGDEIYEAKSADAYIDPKVEVEVVGFENFSVIVTQTKK